MYLFCISCKQIVATIKVPTLVSDIYKKQGVWWKLDLSGSS